MKQRVPILSGPKREKFTSLKEVIFCGDYSSSSNGNTQCFNNQVSGPQDRASGCFMVYEYVEHDLMGLIRRKVKFSIPQIKYILKEVLEAVDSLHSEHIEHGHLKSIER